ncbi:MAG TPA: hypothetical protein HA362_02215 [Nanoarchaeota archaeon]|nr:hypothetical protein [Nanoarchaeota archaeon]
MALSRKGSTESLSTLIGVIVAILIIVPVGIAFYHYIAAETNMEKTLAMLVKRTGSLDDGEKGAIVGYIDEGYILIGFQKDATDFGSNRFWWSCGEGFWNRYTMLWNIKKPASCKDKACLCACKFVDVWGAEPVLQPSACEQGMCVPYEEDFDEVMHGGPACEFGPWIDTENNPVVEIHYEKKGDITGICEHEECVSSDLDKARKVFTEFYNSYMECRNYNSNDCICDKVYVEEMPRNYEIALDGNGVKTTIKLVDTESKAMSSRLVEPDTFGVYNPATDEARERSSLRIISFLPSINPTEASDIRPDSTRLPVILFKAKNGAVSMVQGRLEDAIAKGKDYCTAEKAEPCSFGIGGETLYGLCVNTSCDMPFWAETEALPEGKCGREGYVCCKEKNPCEFSGGLCREGCAQGEIELKHPAYGSMACQLDNQVCCAPAGTALPGGNQCQSNFGVCRKGLCRADTEYRDSDYRCDSSEEVCCMVQGQLSEYKSDIALTRQEEETRTRIANAPPAPEQCANAGDEFCGPSPCDLSTQTPLEGKICPGASPYCCRQGSQCEKMAGGTCKNVCEERLNEEMASGSLFTSPPCGSGEVCCVETIIPLGTGG